MIDNKLVEWSKDYKLFIENIVNMSSYTSEFANPSHKAYHDAINAFEKGNNVILCMPEKVDAWLIIGAYLAWKVIFKETKLSYDSLIDGLVYSVRDSEMPENSIDYDTQYIYANHPEWLNRIKHMFIVCTPIELNGYLKAVSELPPKDNTTNIYPISLYNNSFKAMNLPQKWFDEMVKEYGIKDVYKHL